MADVTTARLWAATTMPYLAAALFACELVVDSSTSTLYVTPRMRVHYNPDLIAAASVPEAGSMLLHEVQHPLRQFEERLGARDRQLFNVAQDAAINTDLEREPRITLPTWVVRTEDVTGATPGMSSEEIYDRLADRQDLDTSDVGTSETESASQVGRPSPQHEACAQGTDEAACDDGPGGLDEIDCEIMRRRVASDIIEHAKRSRGSVPVGLRRWAEQLFTPAVDWRRELMALLRGVSTSRAGLADYTYQRPSRRRPAAGVVMPAMAAPTPPRVAVVADTSGSMDECDLGRILAEIDGLCRRVTETVTVFSTDAASSPEQKVRSARQVHLRGGGGTDMRVGIRAAIETTDPDAVVVITDGLTPWPEANPAPKTHFIAAVVGTTAAAAPEWMRTIKVPR